MLLVFPASERKKLLFTSTAGTDLQQVLFCFFRSFNHITVLCYGVVCANHILILHYNVGYLTNMNFMNGAFTCFNSKLFQNNVPRARHVDTSKARRCCTLLSLHICHYYSRNKSIVNQDSHQF